MKRYLLVLIVVVCTLSYGFRVNLVNPKEPKMIHVPLQEEFSEFEENPDTIGASIVLPIVKGQQEITPPLDFDMILMNSDEAEMDEIETIKRLLRKVRIVHLNYRETLN